MRYPQADFPVLSAETYDVGYQFRGIVHKQTPGDPPFMEDPPASRKRKGTDVIVDQDEGEEGKKRARGRPRLNPKDHTQAERRRTQIRLAQRAYRNRKESAIAELESQVRDLKEVNDEMRDAFQRLLDSATRQGVLAREPEFGQQLRKFQALVRRPREDGAEDESALVAEVEDSPRGSRPESAKSPSTQGATTAEAKHNRPEQLYGGLLIAPERGAQPQSHSLTGLTGSSMNDDIGNYQIIAAPTIENASSALDTSFMFRSAPDSWSFSPWSSLPVPASMAYQESGFARRLHRYAVEKAAYLICMKNPPHETITRVFGFARLFETTDQIRERTLATLAKTRDQPLHNWNYPFHSLGGAGTHFPDRGGAGGFRLGPMDEAASHIRDSLLTVSQNIRMPGLQGLFWDCDEVEWYMRLNGVLVPDVAADFCSVHLQPGSFRYQEVCHRGADDHAPHGAAPAPASLFAPEPSHDGTSMAASSATSDAWQQADASGEFMGPAAAQAAIHGMTQGFAGSTLQAYGSSGVADPLSGSADGNLAQLDITKFLNGLVSRAACLGRTPGFRPKDVDAAFWESVIMEREL
ncbi:hypothetical protein DL766_009646 [Monosporascus sp. MC13-8B]|uniref:BZIP domain-containing protein n=1 Tax=Monosporascus cannonballus TaxID=155416 RepID=A0ABY0GYN6_9PEZI|nr:hypothetical protein DL762_009194 [Monosporascus cannonballus]RYO96083.1 hypothetical protein DL763_003373 [Monosporascus cannonballus]RYP14519.1 hypothetical protein DL766_009646 [Monosporascus sp. MC13-8B]